MTLRSVPLALAITACSGAGLAPFEEDDAAGALLRVEPAGDVAFGPVPVGLRVAERTLTLFSEGDAPVTIADVTLSEDTPAAFWLDPELVVPFGVPAGTTREITLYFAPESVGAYNGQVSVDDGGRDLQRRLSGEGCDPGSSGVCD